MTAVNPRPIVRLQRFSEVDHYKIAAGYVDPRGWDILGSDHRRLGVIRDLIVDVSARRALYLDVELGDAPTTARASDHVLIPTEAVVLDRTQRRARVTALSAESAAGLPVFAGLPLNYDPDLPFRLARWEDAEGRSAGATIAIEPKRRSFWPWVVTAAGLTGIALVGIYGLSRAHEQVALGEPIVARPAGEPKISPPPTPMPLAVESYLAFMRRTRTTMAHVDRDYTVQGLQKLQQALTSLAGDDPRSAESLLEIQRRADQLAQGDARSPAHTDEVRKAFSSAVGLVEQMAERRAPGSTELRDEIAEMRAAADAVRADRPLSEQEGTLRRFFDQASDAIYTFVLEAPSSSVEGASAGPVVPPYPAR